MILELGFLSNSKDEKLLISESGQLKLAKHIFEGFKTYKNTYDGVDKSLTITQKNKGGDLIDSSTVSLSSGKLYKVQLATSSQKIPTLPENFNGLKDVEVSVSYTHLTLPTTPYV